jgi:hypothetical protein
MSTIVSNWQPFSFSFNLVNTEKSAGARSGEYGRWLSTATAFLARKVLTFVTMWAGTLSCKSCQGVCSKSGLTWFLTNKFLMDYSLGIDECSQYGFDARFLKMNLFWSWWAGNSYSALYLFISGSCWKDHNLSPVMIAYRKPGSLSAVFTKLLHASSHLSFSSSCKLWGINLT